MTMLPPRSPPLVTPAHSSSTSADSRLTGYTAPWTDIGSDGLRAVSVGVDGFAVDWQLATRAGEPR